MRKENFGYSSILHETRLRYVPWGEEHTNILAVKSSVCNLSYVVTVMLQHKWLSPEGSTTLKLSLPVGIITNDPVPWDSSLCYHLLPSVWVKVFQEISTPDILSFASWPHHNRPDFTTLTIQVLNCIKELHKNAHSFVFWAVHIWNTKHMVKHTHIAP